MKRLAVIFPMVCASSALHAQTQTLEAAQHALLTATPKSAQPSDGLQPAFPTPKAVAMSYCVAQPNSFGTIAIISYMGSLDLHDNSFGLVVTGAPPVPTSYGMFTYGSQTASVPFSAGTLCVNPGVMERFPVQSLSSDGTVTFAMENHPKEFAPFKPGSRWNFQFWYRNPAGAKGTVDTLNFSNGLHVQFAP